MHLHLPFESPWVVKQAANNQYAAILPGPANAPPDVIVTYGPITIKPDEPRRWLETVQADIPRDTKIQWGRTIDHKTQSDWPMRLVEAQVVTLKGETVEARLCVFYTFMEHGAVAIVRAASAQQLEQHGKSVLATLEHGRPDWRDVPVCLADA